MLGHWCVAAADDGGGKGGWEGSGKCCGGKAVRGGWGSGFLHLDTNGSVTHTRVFRVKSSENNTAINPPSDGLHFLISIHGFAHRRSVSSRGGPRRARLPGSFSCPSPMTQRQDSD